MTRNRIVKSAVAVAALAAGVFFARPLFAGHGDAGIVNRRCPIMGSPIDPAKVPAGLTREYKGQKVAFCCGGCPGQWDRLSDAEKEAKLREASRPTRATP